jgi:hypothetical protein
MLAAEMRENVNALQQKFIEQLTGELFPGRRHSEPQKLCFQLRFHPLYREDNNDNIAKTISKKLNGGFSESSIAPTVSDVVKKLRGKFEENMKADGVLVDRLNAGKGRPQDISPWEIVYNWLWETEFPRRGWALSQEIATCALEELQMQPVAEDTRRDWEDDIPEVCGNTIQKGKPYRLQVELQQQGCLLLINQGVSGTKYLLCPSKAFAPVCEIGAAAPMALPQKEALKKTPLTFGAAGDEFFLAIVTEQPLKLSWVRPESNPKDETAISEERLREIFQKVAQQPSCQVFYRTFAVAE